MVISNGANIPEENKLRSLLEKIAADLNAKYGDEFRAITISFDKNKLPDGFDKEMGHIFAENESGRKEIVFGINGKRVKGLEGDCIRAYFSHADVQQFARKHLEEYIKKEGIANVIYEKFTNSKF